MKKIILASLLTLSLSSVFAQNTNLIKKQIEKNYPALSVSNVTYLEDIKLYEISTKVDGKSLFFFTDEKLNFLINVNSGEVLSTKTKKNVTAQRQKERNIQEFNNLPFETAIKVVKGNGSKKVAIFTDPDCPICQKMEKDWEINSPTNVTIYYFMNPLKSIHPKADERAKKIFCSAEPAKSWVTYLTAVDRKNPEKILPQNDGNCKNSLNVDKHDELAEFLGFNSTPTFMFDNGKNPFEGFMNATQLDVMLEK